MSSKKLDEKIRIKNNKLPTEGVHIGKVCRENHYLPGVEYTVLTSIANDLIKRKGFSQIKGGIK